MNEDEKEKKICDAIKNKQKVEIIYDYHKRIIEPHTFGINALRHKLISAWQVEGYSSSGQTNGWKLFDIRKISNITILDETFNKREGYNPFPSKKMFRYVIQKIPLSE